MDCMPYVTGRALDLDSDVITAEVDQPLIPGYPAPIVLETSLGLLELIATVVWCEPAGPGVWRTGLTILAAG